MNLPYRYQLQKYSTSSSRHTCPSCNRKRQFTFYVDTETGQLLPSHVGICNRKDSCGYHYSPKQFFIDSRIPNVNLFANSKNVSIFSEQKELSYISPDLFDRSFSGNINVNNNFVKWLRTLFTSDQVNNAIGDYRIGNTSLWPGVAIFWQIDTLGRIHTGKIVQYSPLTGRRDKSTFPSVSWVHSVEKLKDFELQQCLFGEHLLSYPDNATKIIGIVESEKTAIVCSMLMSELVWLSRGSKTGAKWYLPGVHKCLIGRRVVLFPDLGAYEAWKEEADKLNYQGCNGIVNRVLEDQATKSDRRAGLDIADFLIKKTENFT